MNTKTFTSVAALVAVIAGVVFLFPARPVIRDEGNKLDEKAASTTASSTYSVVVTSPSRESTLIAGNTYTVTWREKGPAENENDYWVYLAKDSVPAEFGDRSLGGHVVNIDSVDRSASSTTWTVPEYLQQGDDYRIVLSEFRSGGDVVVGYSDTFAIQRNGTTTSKVDPGVVAAVNAVSRSPLGKRIEAAAPGTFDPARIGHDLRGFVSVYARYYKSKNVYLVEVYLDVDGHCYRGEEGCLMKKVFTNKELDAARGTVSLDEFVATESDITFDVTPEGKVGDYKITSATRSDAESRREQLKAEGYY